jgi:hypothetical protein
MTNMCSDIDRPDAHCAQDEAQGWVRKKRILYAILGVYAVLRPIVVRFDRPRTLSRLVPAEDPSPVLAAAAHTRELAR